MATYYVREHGATIHKQDERLSVVRDQKTLATIPLHRLEQLVVWSTVQVTSQTLVFLMERGVDVVFMTPGGYIPGRVLGKEHNFAELRLRQFRATNDPATMLYLAKQIVRGKVSNQLALLRHAVQPQPQHLKTPLLPAPDGAPPKPDTPQRMLRANQSRAVQVALRSIPELLSEAYATDNPDSLRGYEGKAGALYWPAFASLLSGSEASEGANTWGFKGRNYNPARDPINALLSFGYALLQKDVLAAVQIVGLDPYLGCLHTVQYGRPSLALDLMEEFRPVLVDAWVVRLVVQGQIKLRDFVRAKNDPKRPVHLTEAALKRVILTYEAKATTTVKYALTGENTLLRRCIELQVRQFARVIRGEQGQYEPFIG